MIHTDRPVVFREESAEILFEGAPRHAVDEELGEVPRIHLILGGIERPRRSVGALPLGQLQSHLRVLHAVVLALRAHLRGEQALAKVGQAWGGPREVLIREEEGGVDDGEVVKLERLEIVHEPVAHEDGLRSDNIAEGRLYVRKSGLDPLEVLHLETSDVLLEVDDLPGWLHQRLQQDAAVDVHDGDAHERARVLVRLAHLAVDSDHARRDLLLLAPSRRALPLAALPAGEVRGQLGVGLSVVGVCDSASHQGPGTGGGCLALGLISLPRCPLVAACGPSRPPEMTARQGLVRFLSLGICQDVVYERGEGGPVVTRGIVPGLAGARLRRLEPILEVALRSSEVGGVEASAHDRATDGAKKVTGERSEGGRLRSVGRRAPWIPRRPPSAAPSPGARGTPCPPRRTSPQSSVPSFDPSWLRARGAMGCAGPPPG